MEKRKPPRAQEAPGKVRQAFPLLGLGENYFPFSAAAAAAGVKIISQTRMGFALMKKFIIPGSSKCTVAAGTVEFESWCGVVAFAVWYITFRTRKRGFVAALSSAKTETRACLQIVWAN